MDAEEVTQGLRVCTSNKLLANTDASEQSPCSEMSDLSYNFLDRKDIWVQLINAEVKLTNKKQGKTNRRSQLKE